MGLSICHRETRKVVAICLSTFIRSRQNVATLVSPDQTASLTPDRALKLRVVVRLRLRLLPPGCLPIPPRLAPQPTSPTTPKATSAAKPTHRRHRRRRISSTEEKRILTASIYGVDIDAQAVESASSPSCSNCSRAKLVSSPLVSTASCPTSATTSAAATPHRLGLLCQPAFARRRRDHPRQPLRLAALLPRSLRPGRLRRRHRQPALGGRSFQRLALYPLFVPKKHKSTCG